MGMYDYLGEEQVKCFPVASLCVNENEINIRTITGALRGYKVLDLVPHRTRYYDYGENFLIFDYRKSFWQNEFTGLVHIIENGRYKGSKHYSSLNPDYNIELVIDNYGVPLNIKKVSDFAKILQDEELNTKVYFELLKMYMIRLSAIPIKTKEDIQSLREKGWTDDMIKENLTKESTAMQCAHDDSWGLFFEKWTNISLIANIFGGNPIGVLYDCYLRDKHNYDWAGIVKKLEEEAQKEKTSLKAQIDAYLNWTQEHKIRIDEKELLTLFLGKSGVDNV